MPRRSEPLDGFWLPTSLGNTLSGLDWEVQDLAAGRFVGPGEGVAVRWPRLRPEQWPALLHDLDARRGPASAELLPRWQRALRAIPEILMGDRVRLEAVAECTGYPVPMLVFALAQGELVHLDAFARAISEGPTWAAAQRWQPMPGGLPGRLRFFPARHFDRWTAFLRGDAPLFSPLPPVALALGFAAGNVPGSGLLIAMLLHMANHTALGAARPMAPVVLVRNSRHAPLLAPWVLSAVERVDPELVQGLAVLIWDHEDAPVQRLLLSCSDLALAAASDETIGSLDVQLKAVGRRVRFHRHGHKVSFSAIGREALGNNLVLCARLAAVDSSLWDQYGCLSSRVHFVERGGRRAPEDYGDALAEAMRGLARRLPRGGAPIRFLHQAYDTYKLLEPAGGVRVLTDYADDFLVVVDDREWDAVHWRATVNRCTGRVIVVRPVHDLSEVPHRYLRLLPAANLQSMSVAIPADRFLALAEATGACGVTALRSLGHAAFPRLAYSWDGLLALDLGNRRCPGHFTTVETDDPLADLAPTASQLSL